MLSTDCYTMLSYPLLPHPMYHAIIWCYHPMLSSAVIICCYHLMLSSAVIICCYHLMLSSDVIIHCYHPLLSSPVIIPCYPLLSSPVIIPCYHPLLSHVIISCYHLMSSSHVIISCYHLMLSSQGITASIFIIPENLIHWIFCTQSTSYVSLENCLCTTLTKRIGDARIYLCSLYMQKFNVSKTNINTVDHFTLILVNIYHMWQESCCHTAPYTTEIMVI
jgi:hypothetical protein